MRNRDLQGQGGIYVAASLPSMAPASLSLSLLCLTPSKLFCMKTPAPCGLPAFWPFTWDCVKLFPLNPPSTPLSPPRSSSLLLTCTHTLPTGPNTQRQRKRGQNRGNELERERSLGWTERCYIHDLCCGEVLHLLSWSLFHANTFDFIPGPDESMQPNTEAFRSSAGLTDSLLLLAWAWAFSLTKSHQEGQSSVLRCREMRGMELLGQRLIKWAGKKLKTGVDPHCVRIIKTRFIKPSCWCECCFGITMAFCLAFSIIAYCTNACVKLNIFEIYGDETGIMPILFSIHYITNYRTWSSNVELPIKCVE